jgi:hypothetical protein
MLEILTLASFLLIFVRMKSKREMRKSMCVSTSTTNEQETRFVDEDEDVNSPTQAYADLEGQKRPFSDEKELGAKA